MSDTLERWFVVDNRGLPTSVSPFKVRFNAEKVAHERNTNDEVIGFKEHRPYCVVRLLPEAP